MSSYTANDLQRRGSVVPPLDSAPSLPASCDVLIYGTGLMESMLAAALSWQGTAVFHADAAPYYGDNSAVLSLKELQSWVSDVNSPDNTSVFSDAKLYMSKSMITMAKAGPSQSTKATRYLVDTNPHIMFAKSDLLALIVKARVSQYLEFKAIGSFHTFENDSFDKVPTSKEDIFTAQEIDIPTKRALMKFTKFVLAYETHPEVWAAYKNKPIDEFLTVVFKLPQRQVVELVQTIGLANSMDVSTPRGLMLIRRYLGSLDVYGTFPAMYSMYGSNSEIAQGFCRLAAVGGAMYKLNSKITKLDVQNKKVEFADGSKINVNERVVVSPQYYAQEDAKAHPQRYSTITRLTVVVNKDCTEWFAEGESAAVVIFPVGSLPSKNKKSVRALVYGAGTGQVPAGSSIWYLGTKEHDAQQASSDLESALNQLEASILRETTEDFEIDNVTENDVIFKDGLPLVSSVKLGQSMQNFVPKEQLNYDLKLQYRQLVAAKPLQATAHDDEFVLRAPLRNFEVSYDGVVDLTKKLYEAVTGSDDDFFEIDFEDDDEIEDRAEMDPDEEKHEEMADAMEM